MADMSVALNKPAGEKQLQSISGATDSVNECPAPLDFSFLHLTTLEDAEKEEPRVPMLGKIVTPRGSGGKFAGRCLRMNNNQLSEIKTLNAFITRTFVNPSMIGWIDLSFNALQIIDPILVDFTNLEILNLHSNSISNLNEVNKLASLANLRKLTLHGNPMETQPNYRWYVLSTLPHLRSFDFSAITKCDRKTAECWKRSNNTTKKKKKIDSED